MARGNKPSVQTVVKQATARAKKAPAPRKRPFNPAEYISSGSTLLNLALTDHPRCGWMLGRMSNIIGDSSSGKTFLVLTTFAEANSNKRFEDYRFIYDDSEHANSFDMEGLFGIGVKERVESPEYYSDGTERPSRVVEDFYASVRRACKNKDPFIYVLDSMDAISSEEDEKKIDEIDTHREKVKKAEEDGKSIKDISGSYGMGKPKINSKMLGNICGKVEEAESALLIISQTRDDINPMTFSKKTRSGGKALKFYANHEVWTAVGGSIKVKDRVIGVLCKIKVSKNKVTGKVREVEFPIYYEFGIDNIGSIIDFLVKEGFWSKAKGASTIDPQGDLELPKASKDKLISLIEEGNLETKLDRLVSEAWDEIENSLKRNRKKRYA